MREIGYSRNIWIFFAFSFIVGSILYSCSSQRGLAQVTTNDTIKGSQENKPTITPNLTRNPLRMSLEEQKAFNKKLSYVLDNSEKTFNDVSDIKGYLKDITQIILDRASQLRNQNDSLRFVVMQGNRNMIAIQQFAQEERLARLESEKQNRLEQKRLEEKTQQEREQNRAYRDTITVLITVAFTIFVVLLIGVVILLVLVHRQKVYLRTHFSNV